MELVMAIIFLLIIACIILLWYITTFNSYQNYIIRINEAEADIDSTLRKRFDLLNKAIGIIGTITEEEKVLDGITLLKTKKLTNFELDRELYDAISQFQKFSEKYPKLKQNENYMKIELSINETEAEIVASRKYYNDIITDYNKLVKTFPTNITAKVNKYKVKTYFDGKNMEDNIKNDFKL